MSYTYETGYCIVASEFPKDCKFFTGKKEINEVEEEGVFLFPKEIFAEVAGYSSRSCAVTK